MVSFFSSPENTTIDTAGLIIKFKPSSEKAREWHKKMLSYLNNGIELLLVNLKR